MEDSKMEIKSSSNQLNVRTLRIYEKEIAKYRRNYLSMYGSLENADSEIGILAYSTHCFPHYVKSVYSLRLHFSALKYWYKSNAGKDLKISTSGHNFNRKKILFIEEDEIKTITEKIENHVIKSILLLVYYTGARLTEILKIKVSDYSYEKKQIYIFDEKKNILRTLPIPIKMNYLLFRETHDKNIDDYLFTLTKSHSISPRTVQKYLQKAVSLHNDLSITISSLRHNFIIFLIHQGFNSKEIKDFMGYKTVKSIRRHHSLPHKKESNILKIYE